MKTICGLCICLTETPLAFSNKFVFTTNKQETQRLEGEKERRSILLTILFFFSPPQAVTANIKPRAEGIPFTSAYAVSNNGRAIYDLTETIDNLGYTPVDDAEKYF